MGSSVRHVFPVALLMEFHVAGSRLHRMVGAPASCSGIFRCSTCQRHRTGVLANNVSVTMRFPDSATVFRGALT
jgi:hypothetical protein